MKGSVSCSYDDLVRRVAFCRSERCGTVAECMEEELVGKTENGND